MQMLSPSPSSSSAPAQPPSSEPPPTQQQEHCSDDPSHNTEVSSTLHDQPSSVSPASTTHPTSRSRSTSASSSSPQFATEKPALSWSSSSDEDAADRTLVADDDDFDMDPDCDVSARLMLKEEQEEEHVGDTPTGTAASAPPASSLAVGDDNVDPAAAAPADAASDALDMDLKVVCPFDSKAYHEQQVAVLRDVSEDGESDVEEADDVTMEEPLIQEVVLSVTVGDADDAFEQRQQEQNLSAEDTFTYFGMPRSAVFPTHPAIESKSFPLDGFHLRHHHHHHHHHINNGEESHPQHHHGAADSDAIAAQWLLGRPASYYPGESDPRLPWHFSWVDDGMLGGMSAPLDRSHWKAMKEHGIGLVVNLTEFLVVDRSTLPMQDRERERRCTECYATEERAEDGVFDDLTLSDGVEVLFLPVRDGAIPSLRQLRIFVRAARAAVDQGRRVVVHCQAGVGRTGTFLAVWLMHKYRCSATEAVRRLRAARPQSMQFHRSRWQTETFWLHDHVATPAGGVRWRNAPSNNNTANNTTANSGLVSLASLASDVYNRNLLQERFLERYEAVATRTGFDLDDLDPDEDAAPLDPAAASPRSRIDVHSTILAHLDFQLDAKMSEVLAAHHHGRERAAAMAAAAAAEDDDDDGAGPQHGGFVCWVCKGVDALGPEPVVPGRPWPAPIPAAASRRTRRPTLSAASASSRSPTPSPAAADVPREMMALMAAAAAAAAASDNAVVAAVADAVAEVESSAAAAPGEVENPWMTVRC